MTYTIFDHAQHPEKHKLKTYNSEMLQAVFIREKPFRPGWPDSFEKMEADPLLSRILRLLADHPPEKSAPVKQRNTRPAELEETEEQRVLERMQFEERDAEKRSRALWDAATNETPPPRRLSGKDLASGEKNEDQK